jgi:hypothetical protein
MMRTYQQNLPGTYGPLERTAAYWQWLLRRHAFDEIYVALEGDDPLDLCEHHTRMVGYAVLRGERIVELMTAKGELRAGWELLWRVCHDAIEHGRTCLTLHAPPDHFLHSLFLEAGGLHRLCEAEHGEVLMARLLNPLKLLRRLAGQLHARARHAQLPLPLNLGLAVENKKYLIEVRRQGVRIISRQLSRHFLTLNVADFTRLVLGQLDWDWVLRDARVIASTALAAQAGRALFPPLPFYRPPWDDLPADPNELSPA